MLLRFCYNLFKMSRGSILNLAVVDIILIVLSLHNEKLLKVII